MTNHRTAPFLISHFPLFITGLALVLFACKYAAQKDRPDASFKDKPTRSMPKPLPVPGDYAAE